MHLLTPNYRITVTQTGLDPNESGDQFGDALAIGDFDGDGRENDLAVRDPGEAPGSSPESGYVFVFKGTNDGFQPLQRFGQGGLGNNLWVCP